MPTRSRCRPERRRRIAERSLPAPRRRYYLRADRRGWRGSGRHRGRGAGTYPAAIVQGIRGEVAQLRGDMGPARDQSTWRGPSPTGRTAAATGSPPQKPPSWQPCSTATGNVEVQLAERISNAMWLVEQSARRKMRLQALLSIVACLEALLNTGRHPTTKQFKQRVTDMARELGVNGLSRSMAERLCEQRSTAATAAGCAWSRRNPGEPLPDHSERETRAISEPAPVQDVLRAAVRNCIEDPVCSRGTALTKPRFARNGHSPTATATPCRTTAGTAGLALNGAAAIHRPAVAAPGVTSALATRTGSPTRGLPPRLEPQDERRGYAEKDRADRSDRVHPL